MKFSSSILFVAFHLKFSVPFRIQCAFGSIYFFVGNEKQTEKYGCRAVLKPNDQEDYVTEVSHNHLSMKSDNDVKNFYYKFGQIIPKLPKFTNVFFPKLEAYSASNISLEVVSALDFINMPTLQFISLYSNKLKEIPSDLFMYTPNLVFVSISRNNIQHVGSHFFDHLNLKKLKFLSTYKNPCTSEKFPHVEKGNPEQFEKVRLKFLNDCKPTRAMIKEEERKADQMSHHYLQNFRKT
jgi:hypothetical protein